MKHAQPKTIYLKDYKKPSYIADSIALDFDVRGDEVTVINTSVYRCDDPSHPPLTLHRGKYPELVSVTIDGREVDYTLSADALSIPHPAKESFTLVITSTITPGDNTDLEGLYLSGDMLCTQCEAEGFRNITFWQDRPDVMSVFTVRIEADKAPYPVLLSNGDLVESGDLEGGRHFTKWHDPHKKPGHLFALVAGDLDYIQDHFITMNGRHVDLRIYAPSEDMEQLDHAMHALKISMKWDEEAYGREYDLNRFNIVSAHDFNSGAMENKSLNIFNAQLVLAHPETATDDDYNRILRVIGHEYFHNWSGNRVGLKQWFQLSLKEGFTVYRENGFGQAVNDPVIERIDEVRLLREMQFPEDAGPMAHPVRPDEFIEIRNFYTMTVYEKGAEVIGMMETLLGSEAFRKGCDLFFERFDGDTATTEDFLTCMEDVSGKTLDQFSRWYQYAGTPDVSLTSRYEDGTLRLNLKQSVPDTPGTDQQNKLPMVIPIRTGFLNDQGREIREEILVLSDREQEFVLDGFDARPIPSYLRGFSAPITLNTDMSDDERLFLLAHDTDGFNRWEMSQRLGLQAILRRLGGGAKDQDYADALARAVTRLKDDNKALLARMLTLPEETVIAQNLKGHVDPVAVAAARNTVGQDITAQAMDLFEDLYQDNAPASENFDTSPQAIGRRALRQAALRLIASVDTARGVDLAQTQYQTAITMTERAGALSVLADTQSPERDACFADFYDRFKDKELVVNKWFALQAMANRDSIIDDVMGLQNHPDFNLFNPNRLRSVVGAFAIRNPFGFHHSSGQGYKILADTVIALNGKNDQVAARMLSPMRQWKIYTEDRQTMMKTELQRILATADLSNDIFEVADKTLNG